MTEKLEKPQEEIPEVPEKEEAPTSPFPEGHKFHGKGVEDFTKSYEELERKLVSQAEENKRQKEDLQAYQMMAQQGPQQSAQVQKDPSEEFNTMFYENPLKALQMFSQQQEMTRAYGRAYSDGPRAFMQAKQLRPDVFEGVDDNRLQQVVLGGVQANQLHPDLATKPETWMMAAIQVKAADSGFKFNSPAPMNPPQTDSPPLRRQVDSTDDDDVPLTDQAKFLVSQLGEGANIKNIQKRVQKIRAERNKNEGA